MATIKLTLQDVNGDPFTSGNNINIVTSQTPNAVFNEPSGTTTLEIVSAGDTVTIGGFTYTYDYLGSGDIDSDPTLPAAFIRITGSSDPNATIPIGTTYAIDLTGQPGDPGYPDLPNGNTKLGVADLNTTDPTPFPCFVAGTLIETLDGPRAVEDIEVGDMVWTMDNGFQPVRWIGTAEVAAEGDMAPIEFAPGAIGNTAALRVSPQHRVLVSGWKAELYCGSDQVLVAAAHLVTGDAVRRLSGGQVTYVHLLFDQHEIVETDGALTESLYIGPESVKALPQESVEELLTLFPELMSRAGQYPVARHVAKRHEATLLASA
ncbi:Hint domain-containing protein [uncultured Aliiroseovarius sp.]|uniref:Hint domain-containing protein n=1 Tax=uncultured Aliiroseovarius sp. TaxID=1658783 RepID=UPI0026200F48|nr:Hint domain-containing protein [uncultured Aliiroseovarius sp.]